MLFKKVQNNLVSKINCPTIKINDDNGKNIDNTIVLPKTTIAQVSIISNPIKHNVLNVLPLDHEMFYTPNYCFPGICKKILQYKKAQTRS